MGERRTWRRGQEPVVVRRRHETGSSVVMPLLTLWAGDKRGKS